MEEKPELSAEDQARLALAACYDAASDCRVRIFTIEKAIARDCLLSLDVVEGVTGLERQAERLIEMAGQIRRAQSRAGHR